MKKGIDNKENMIEVKQNDKYSFESFCKSLKDYWYIPFTLAVLSVFWDFINDLALDVLVPFSSKALNNSWLVEIVLAVSVILFYLPRFSCLWKNKTTPINRWINIAFLLIIYFFFENWGKFDFYGVIPGVSYILSCFLIAVFIEASLFLATKKVSTKNKAAIFNNELPSFFELDAPTEKDEHDRNRYASLLVSKIIASAKNNIVDERAFTILLNERYGVGKSSFLLSFINILQKHKIGIIEFKPWLCDSPDGIVSSFFDTLSKEIECDNHVLARKFELYSELLLDEKKAGWIHNLLGIFNRSTVSDVHRHIADALKKFKFPIVVIVDDVDRLQYDELMALLKLIRNTADFPNLFYVVAADKTSICDNIRNGGLIADPDLYLKKFFSFELMFPADEHDIKKDLADRLSSAVPEFRDSIHKYIYEIKYLEAAIANHRDIIRFTNQFNFTVELMRSQRLDLLQEIDICDLINISLLQFVNGDIYKILRDHDDWLLTSLGVDSHLVVKQEYENAIKNKTFHRDMLNVRMNMSNVSPEKREASKTEYEKLLPDDLGGVIEDSTAKSNDIVCSLLSDMFGNAHGPYDKRSICIAKNYYLYFASKYKKNEIPKSQAIGLLQLDDKEASEVIPNLIQENKGDSVLIGFSLYADGFNLPNLKAVKNVLLTYNEIYQQSNTFFSMCQYAEHSGCSSIIRRMFLKRKEDSRSLTKEELSDFSFFFNTDSRLNLLAVAVKNMPTRQSDSSFVSRDNVFQWRDIIIRRYINSLENSTNWEDDNLAAFKDILWLHEVVFYSEFETFIKSVEDGGFWLFNIVQKKQNTNILQWNDNFKELIAIDEYGLGKYAMMIRHRISEQEYEDLVMLQKEDSISGLALNEHPYLQAASKWLDSDHT